MLDRWFRWLMSNVGTISPILATGILLLFVYNRINITLPPFLWLVLTLFVYITFFVVRIIVARPKDLNSIIRVGDLRLGAVSLFATIIVATLVLIATTLSSVIAGWPNDLRHMVNPSIIRRDPFPSQGIDLGRLSGDVLFQRLQPLAPRVGWDIDDEKRRLVWEEWMFNGATSGNGITVTVYTSQQVSSYYQRTNARIEFGGLPNTAVLAECVGFIRNTGQDGRADQLRSINISGVRENTVSTSTNKLRNEIHDLMLDSGDSVVIIAQFLGVPPNTRSAASVQAGLPPKAGGTSQPSKR